MSLESFFHPSSLIPHPSLLRWDQGIERREAKIPEHAKSDDEDNQQTDQPRGNGWHAHPLIRDHAQPQASAPVSDKRQQHKKQGIVRRCQAQIAVQQKVQAACRATAGTVQTRYEVEETRGIETTRTRGKPVEHDGTGQGSAGEAPGEPTADRGMRRHVCAGWDTAIVGSLRCWNWLAESFVPSSLPRSAKVRML